MVQVGAGSEIERAFLTEEGQPIEARSRPRMMAGLLEAGASAGAGTVWLEVADDNDAALALYAGLGRRHHACRYRRLPPRPEAALSAEGQTSTSARDPLVRARSRAVSSSSRRRCTWSYLDALRCVDAAGDGADGGLDGGHLAGDAARDQQLQDLVPGHRHPLLPETVYPPSTHLNPLLNPQNCPRSRPCRTRIRPEAWVASLAWPSHRFPQPRPRLRRSRRPRERSTARCWTGRWRAHRTGRDVRADYGQCLLLPARGVLHACPTGRARTCPSRCTSTSSSTTSTPASRPSWRWARRSTSTSPASRFRVFLDPAGHPFCLCLD